MTQTVPTTPDPSPGTRLRPMVALRDTGLLWLINRVVFHPRGLALGLHVDDTGHTTWYLHGDRSHPYRFDDEDDQCMYLTAERELGTHTANARWARTHPAEPATEHTTTSILQQLRAAAATPPATHGLSRAEQRHIALAGARDAELRGGATVLDIFHAGITTLTDLAAAPPVSAPCSCSALIDPDPAATRPEEDHR